jgi:hypothetical protein
LSSTAHALRSVPAVFTGDGCFVASTPVLTDEGPRPIAELWPGERVIAQAEDGTLHTRCIEDVQVHRSATLLIDADDELQVSVSQPMLVAGRGFVRASELRVGDELSDPDGTTHRIEQIRPGAHQRVYGLTVARDATYLVGVARLVAHNKPSLAQGIAADRRRAIQRNNSRIHTYSTRNSFLGWRPLAGSAAQERHALAWAAGEVEAQNWVLVRPAKYRGNQGLDMIFKGTGPNAGRWLIVEVKHGTLGSLSTYKEGRQGSKEWAMNRLQRAVNEGKKHGTGYLRYEHLLNEVRNNTGTVEIVGAFYHGGVGGRFARFDPAVFVKSAPRLIEGVHFDYVHASHI